MNLETTLNQTEAMLKDEKLMHVELANELSELRIRCSEQNVEIQDLSNKLSEKDQIATNLQEKFNLFVEQQENYEQNYVNMASETERKTAEINQLKQKFLDKDSDTNIAFNKLKLEKEELKTAVLEKEKELNETRQKL